MSPPGQLNPEHQESFTSQPQPCTHERDQGYRRYGIGIVRSYDASICLLRTAPLVAACYVLWLWRASI